MEKIGSFSFIRSPNTELGKGSYSTVYLGTYDGPTIYNHNQRLLSGSKIAIKVISTKFNSEKSRSILDNEISIMELIRKFPHPNIVTCYDVIVNKVKFETYIIMEHCNSGDLRSILKKPIREKYAQYYFCQLVNGLKHL